MDGRFGAYFLGREGEQEQQHKSTGCVRPVGFAASAEGPRARGYKHGRDLGRW
jgi:hypothetical protein